MKKLLFFQFIGKDRSIEKFELNKQLLERRSLIYLKKVKTIIKTTSNDQHMSYIEGGVNYEKSKAAFAREISADVYLQNKHNQAGNGGLVTKNILHTCSSLSI